jgi:hypothetical protein
MQTREQCLAYKELEQIPHQDSQNQPTRAAKLLSLLQQIWHNFCEFWERGTEPRIWQVKDRSGKLRWKVYDPVKDRSMLFDSEQEVLIWLEQRHDRASQQKGWEDWW